MGGPYEGKREILDVKGFTTKPGIKKAEKIYL